MATDYHAFPGLCVTPGGDLLMGWSAREGHSGGVNDIRTRRSTDGLTGATWAAEESVLSAALTDYGTCVFTVLSDGRIALTSWRRASSAAGNGQLVVMFSSDDGATWGTPIEPAGLTGCYYTESRIVELPGGRLLWPVWGSQASRLVYSDDDGATWALLSSIHDSALYYNEWGLHRFSNGDLCAILRQENGATRGLWSAFSTDAGANWTQPQPLLLGYVGAPRVFEGPDGNIWVASRAPSGEGEKLRLVITNGQEADVSTWQTPTAKPMLYGQFADLDGGDIGLVFSEETSQVEPRTAEVYFTRLTAAA